ncbi:glycosyltransferase family 2 protein [Tamlana sp. 2_MG-2023]|uniref:glycosyltransferase family 2 protein n=1 Tax=unclassified Tamlana TaxID=2614803 RepID=UPI0026E18D1F|nr:MULTISPECIES: glycosyltransferase family 2 protein [unclassified Tamlana]MDO6758748.1 glycosyltransferase family 2 protein [Tamlana sp. 2_MG-2023]MDO6789447.1 glycosyltransferase family 2 protein [Tamlana sp. 1_MG-2023]
MSSPLISIIIPCYNQGKYLNESLLSVYNQTYQNWECLIINDGSTDDSEKIAQEWVYKDDRFKYFHKKNGGVSSARNFAIEKVKGNYIQFLDADDFLDSKKLELSLNALELLPNDNKQLVLSNFRMFLLNTNKTTGPYCFLRKDLFTFESLLYEWNASFSIPIHCAIFETSLFDEIHFPTNLTAQEDWIVWVQIFKLNPLVYFVDKPLALYRRNPEGRTKSRSLLPDQMIAFDMFKTILNKDEFYGLSKVLISRYYVEQKALKARLQIVKSSYPYQTGLMIKKTLKILGLLKISRKLFPFFLKFKSKIE